jgi:hypothetical protein
MLAQPLRRRDLWAGLMLIGIGAGAMIIARNYAFGTTLRMGPGYFPTVLGGILVVLGLHLALRAWRNGAVLSGPWPLRALLVLPLAFALFGLLMTHAGFVPAVLLLIVTAAAAAPQRRPSEVLLLALAITALCTALFIWGLGLPYPLVAGL